MVQQTEPGNTCPIMAQFQENISHRPTDLLYQRPKQVTLKVVYTEDPFSIIQLRYIN